MIEGDNKSFTGMGTFPMHVTTTGPKNVKGKIMLPNIIEGQAVNSQVVVTMNLNGGATFYTGLTGAEGFESGCFAHAGDTINVILSSALPADNSYNDVKTTISFY